MHKYTHTHTQGSHLAASSGATFNHKGAVGRVSRAAHGVAEGHWHELGLEELLVVVDHVLVEVISGELLAYCSRELAAQHPLNIVESVKQLRCDVRRVGSHQHHPHLSAGKEPVADRTLPLPGMPVPGKSHIDGRTDRRYAAPLLRQEERKISHRQHLRSRHAAAFPFFSLNPTFGHAERNRQSYQCRLGRGSVRGRRGARLLEQRQNRQKEVVFVDGKGGPIAAEGAF